MFRKTEFDIAIMASFAIGFQWLYFFASNAWIAVSHFSVTLKVSDGWGSAFHDAHVQKCIRISPFHASTNGYYMRCVFPLLVPSQISIWLCVISFAGSLASWLGISARLYYDGFKAHRCFLKAQKFRLSFANLGDLRPRYIV